MNRENFMQKEINQSQRTNINYSGYHLNMLYIIPRVLKFIEKENRMGIMRELRGGGNRGLLFNAV